MSLFVPPLMGGEIVVAFLIVRIGMWALRSWVSFRGWELQPKPPGGGVPATPERKRELRVVRPTTIQVQDPAELPYAA